MRFYIPVWVKFSLSLAFATAWAVLSYIIGERWIYDLGSHIGMVWAYIVIFGIAIIPGFMNAFMIVSLLLDKRPKFSEKSATYPAVTVLVAAYNEEASIAGTLQSIEAQNYPGKLSVVVINDGSTDRTKEILDAATYPWLRVIHQENKGKSAALNAGLATVTTPITITVDGDSYLHKDALKNLVGRYLSDPIGTAAVAGAPLVRNSRENLVTKVQEWDYFHGIAAVKRMQSLYQGTMVAQGAFSLYETDVLHEVGGWSETVGEDIVLTWAILAKGYRVGFAENACLFTNAPNTWSQFIKQRQRWSRGLIEGFKEHWRLLFKARLSMVFVWWNLLFPYLDLVYTFAFLPGVIAACFGIYWIAGPLTLLVLPLAMLVNFMMFRVQSAMFEEQGLRVRKNVIGFIFYSLLYSLILQPACTIGYVIEFFSKKKNWGTK